MIRRTLLTLTGVVTLVLGLFGGLLLAPAGSVAAQSTPCPEPSDTELEQIAETWVGLFASHDLSALDTLVSPDIGHQSPSAGSVAGRDELEASQQAVLDGFPDLQVTTNLILTDAPYVVVQWTGTGTQTGAFRGQEPTGNVATWDGATLLLVECGQVAQAWTYLDQLSRLQQSEAGAAGTPAAVTDAGSATPADCPALTDETAGQLLDAWWGDVWSGDVALLETLTTEDIYHHWAEGPDSQGQAAQLERISGLTTSLAGVRYTYEDFVVDGDYVAAVWEASDGTITFSGLNIFRTECGQIAEVWSEMDLLGLREQLAALASGTPAP